ncbi:MAG TPA: hypothetical protein PLT25_11635 [Acidocella sp.]|nr:hypothetical protein [Acidocella sp.]HQU05352.1 hypothetical protein [Acidocella sp.]
MTGHIATFLEWSLLDLAVVAFGVQQYISVSRDLKRSKARDTELAAKAPLQPGHPEGQ